MGGRHRDHARRATILILAFGVVVFLALIAGWLDHPQRVPVDTGTPSTVTTIGGPR